MDAPQDIEDEEPCFDISIDFEEDDFLEGDLEEAAKQSEEEGEIEKFLKEMDWEEEVEEVIPVVASKRSLLQYVASKRNKNTER